MNPLLTTPSRQFGITLFSSLYIAIALSRRRRLHAVPGYVALGALSIIRIVVAGMDIGFAVPLRPWKAEAGMAALDAVALVPLFVMFLVVLWWMYVPSRCRGL